MNKLFIVVEKNTGKELSPDDVSPDFLAWKPEGRLSGFVIDEEGSIGIESSSGEVAYLSVLVAERYKAIFNLSKT